MKDDAERARARVTDAIRKADEDFGYSIRLTRLVDDVATYTLTFPGEEPLEFGSNEDANEHVRAERDKRRADAILLAFAQQPEGWVPIADAPNDARELLGWAEGCGFEVVRVDSSGKCYSGAFDADWVKYVRALPSPPAAMLDVAPIPKP